VRARTFPAAKAAGEAPLSWTSVFGEESLKIGAERPEVVAITAAMLEPTGLAPFARAFPDRTFDVGIAELTAAGCDIVRVSVTIHCTWESPRRARRFRERSSPPRPSAPCCGRGSCIGRTLARIELTAAFERLFRRLPNFQLAVPEESLRWQEHRITGGFEEIPVTF
jgi:hypothetical protein